MSLTSPHMNASWPGQNLSRPKPLVTALAVHPAGHCFVVGYSDGSIAFWAVEDQDEPILVRCLGSDDPTADNQLEPVFKLAWSGYPDPSTHVRSGSTTLMILGGLPPDASCGLTVDLLPPYIPPEGVTTSDPQAQALNPLVRKAMHDAAAPTQTYLYECGYAQDFTLLPRNSPHWSGNYDPQLLFVVVETQNKQRVLQGHQLPPPAFAPNPTNEQQPTVPDATPEDISRQLEDLLDDLSLDQALLPISLPLTLSAAATGLVDGSIHVVDRVAYDRIAENAGNQSQFPFQGGFAWSNESHASEIRLAKVCGHYILPDSSLTDNSPTPVSVASSAYYPAQEPHCPIS